MLRARHCADLKCLNFNLRPLATFLRHKICGVAENKFREGISQTIYEQIRLHAQRILTFWGQLSSLSCRTVIRERRLRHGLWWLADKRH